MWSKYDIYANYEDIPDVLKGMCFTFILMVFNLMRSASDMLSIHMNLQESSIDLKHSLSQGSFRQQIRAFADLVQRRI
jgi:hypothetical protein